MSVGILEPFHAVAGSSVTIAASTTSATAALPANGGELLVVNSGTVVAHLSVSGVATLSDLPLPPTSTTLLRVGAYASAVSAITNTGTAAIYVCRGDGSAH